MKKRGRRKSKTGRIKKQHLLSLQRARRPCLCMSFAYKVGGVLKVKMKERCVQKRFENHLHSQTRRKVKKDSKSEAGKADEVSNESTNTCCRIAKSEEMVLEIVNEVKLSGYVRCL
ncbi:hypothetical protein TNCT_293881 [Trichonephila clavata]|uniref:Uncharacterized protein n=1 Tax=Trichonephila clavata TaxID=2740835 RepID=A0A8X6K6W9_TRICU|nr:hypothetical protein TNCT_293881 [Trichonephila clavata]